MVLTGVDLVGILVAGEGLSGSWVYLLLLALWMCGFYGIYMDWVIAGIDIALLRPWGWTRLGSSSFGFLSENCVCSAVFSMTSCSLAMAFGGFLASLDEQGPSLRPLTAARITASSVMPGVLARRWTNLLQKSWRGSLSACVQANSSIGLLVAGLTALKFVHNFSWRFP